MHSCRLTIVEIQYNQTLYPIIGGPLKENLHTGIHLRLLQNGLVAFLVAIVIVAPIISLSPFVTNTMQSYQRAVSKEQLLLSNSKIVSNTIYCRDLI